MVPTPAPGIPDITRRPTAAPDIPLREPLPHHVRIDRTVALFPVILPPPAGPINIQRPYARQLAG